MIRETGRHMWAKIVRLKSRNAEGVQNNNTFLDDGTGILKGSGGALFGRNLKKVSTFCVSKKVRSEDSPFFSPFFQSWNFLGIPKWSRASTKPTYEVSAKRGRKKKVTCNHRPKGGMKIYRKWTSSASKKKKKKKRKVVSTGMSAQKKNQN